MADKKKVKKSKEEIRREFELPERKSKIASILKTDGEVYCICRTSDCTRFMIACDNCEEWYHGDCININEKEAKHIKHYCCQKCKEEDPSLQTVFRVLTMDKTTAPTMGGTGGAASTVGGSAALGNNVDGEKNRKKTNRCGTCEGCRRPNCGVCENCRIRVGHKPRCELRACVNQREQTSSSANVKPRKKEKPPKERSRKRKRSLSPEVYVNPELEGIRQCYGPDCCNCARPQSKYCSKECGLRLATNRILQVMPQRITEWNLTPCRAEQENVKQLEEIRKKQAIVTYALAELDKRHRELDVIIDRARHTLPDPNFTPDNADEDESSMYCITCAHEIHYRTAVKHMEKCFNKYESQASFGSHVKTRIEGTSIFCDFYNIASNTYCKRLRVLCPEHCKDPKVSETDVCGCPLVRKLFEPTGEFCRAPKKSCFKHYVWEKIRRAEIDLERVRQWLKMDELLEQERQTRYQMSSRAGVLGLLLHSTYDHDMVERLMSHQKKMAAMQQKENELKNKKQKQEKKQQQHVLQQQQQVKQEQQQQVKQEQQQQVKREQPVQQQQMLQQQHSLQQQLTQVQVEQQKLLQPQELTKQNKVNQDFQEQLERHIEMQKRKMLKQHEEEQEKMRMKQEEMEKKHKLKQQKKLQKQHQQMQQQYHQQQQQQHFTQQPMSLQQEQSQQQQQAQQQQLTQHQQQAQQQRQLLLQPPQQQLLIQQQMHQQQQLQQRMQQQLQHQQQIQQQQPLQQPVIMIHQIPQQMQQQMPPQMHQQLLQQQQLAQQQLRQQQINYYKNNIN